MTREAYRVECFAHFASPASKDTSAYRQRLINLFSKYRPTLYKMMSLETADELNSTQRKLEKLDENTP